jgi:hypothetical protein
MKLEAKDVHQALKMWNRGSSEGSPIDHLFLFQKRRHEGYSVRMATNEVISKVLETLQAIHPEKAELLRQRFIDGRRVFEIANQLNMSQATIYKRQKRAIEELTEVLSQLEEGTLRSGQEQKVITEPQEVPPQMEQKAIELGQQALEERLLLPSYFKLVGLSEQLTVLNHVLISPEQPLLISIEVIGGIGMCTLADALIRQMIDQGSFEDFAWISAQRVIFDLEGTIKSIDEPALTVKALVETLLRQLLGLSSAGLSEKEAFNRLKSHLKEHAHLIVIDNLETLADISSLLPTLHHLANPTKFLLTSRRGFYPSSNLYHFVVPELSFSNALQLMREEAQRCYLPHLIEADDEALLPIYETVGGHPLALRLIVALTYIQPLDVILSDLVNARGQTVANLYTYIYRHAWNHLDELTRELFLCMPLTTIEQGADFKHLEAITAFEPNELRRALNLLISLNLVDLRGKLGERRYTIHNLTRTFLHEQIVKWQ